MKTFVNLPVRDLEKSIGFFRKMGFKFDPRFTDKNATCMIIGDEAFVMLLVEEFYMGFTKKPIPEAGKGSEVIIALFVESRARVDELVDIAVAAGAKTPMAKQDYGYMYSRGFEDLDGHLWEVGWMDEAGYEASRNAAVPA